MIPEEQCRVAAKSRDARFDGMFYVAVTSTGIYCRPSCPATPPKPAHLRFYPTAAAAQHAGFRACKRCRPDASPGSPEWNLRADVVGRAVRLIGDGVVDRAGVAGLAVRVGYSTRQLSRLVNAELGASPLALARAQRSQNARVLLETTHLRLAEVAFGAGFSSVRQFNDTIRSVFAMTPSELRQKRAAGRRAAPAADGHVRLRLAYRPPIAMKALVEFLSARAVPGVERFDGTSFSRVLDLAHGSAIATVALSPDSANYIECDLVLEDLRDLSSAVGRCRALLDLDADPHAVAEHLGADELLRPLLGAVPGIRVPGAVDGPELAIRAVLGQQISVAAARCLCGRLVKEFGKPLERPVAGLTHRFPTPEMLASLDPAALPLPRARARCLVELAARIADGSLVLDAGADRDLAESELRSISGIGAWTASYIRMRALRDSDAFVVGDLGLRHALLRLGADAPTAFTLERTSSWRPYRAYGVMALWSSLTRSSP